MDNKLFRYNTEIKIVQSSIKKLNPQFSLCDVLVCYHGDNRNWTSLPKNVIEENLYSIYGIPIVGEWIYKLDGTDEKSWGSHGGRIILDDKGVHFEQTTKPFGFVSKEAADNASWVTITEKDGHTKNEYLKLSGCILWTDRYEESKTILDENFGQSMEIEFKKGHYRDDHYYEAEEFIFSALCILGTDCEPCFESACIGRHYELDSFKKEFSLMLDEYRKFNESDGTPATVQNNATNNNPQMEGEQSMDFTKITEALSAHTYKGDDNKDICKYRLLNATDSKVFALDMEDYKPYGFDYAIAKEEEAGNTKEYVVIDFESKVEMSLSATEKNTDENFKELNIKDEIDIAISRFSIVQEAEFEKKLNKVSDEISTKFQKDYDELKESYESIAKANGILQTKVDSYEKAQKEAKVEQHKNDINSLVDSYAEKLGKYSAFLVYKANIEKQYERTCEQVEQDLILMAGKYLTSKEHSMNKKFNYSPTETGVVHKTNEAINDRYGHLLDKYIK